MENFTIDPIILNALREDIGHGDITTGSCIPDDTIAGGRFIAKADGIICGIDVVVRVFALLDNSVKFTAQIKDGDMVQVGDEIAKINGSAKSILKGERVALNFLQHMSGIATMTYKLQSAMPDTCKIVDTRKTMPGLRVFEKYSVLTGGGGNHRFNLSDAVLIKDNHIAAGGGIAKTVAAARKSVPHTIKIEVETATLQQVKQAVDVGADIVMLDNMPLETIGQAIEIIDKRALVEASGNMGEKALSELAAIAETGVDFISVGELTHSARALDISLKLELLNNMY